MSAMQNYSRLHRSLCTQARRHALVPMDLRVLIALEERGGFGQTDELESELFTAGSAIRRSIVTLRERGHLKGGGQAGVRAVIELTESGRDVVRELRDDLQALIDGREPVEAVS